MCWGRASCQGGYSGLLLNLGGGHLNTEGTEDIEGTEKEFLLLLCALYVLCALCVESRFRLRSIARLSTGRVHEVVEWREAFVT
jgi:hypothetical protein